MSEHNYTISESFSLPSKGLIYNPVVDPRFTIRSMTTVEEMKRLAPTDLPYKTLSEMIEDCIIDNKFGMSVYDMCVADYQFLLYKLRIVTYGSDYAMQVKCPKCGKVHNITANLDDLHVIEYDEAKKFNPYVTLPQSGLEIELQFQTLRSIDRIATRRNEIEKESNNKAADPTYYLTLMSFIKTVNGDKLNPVELEVLIKSLPMRDVNTLITASNKLNEDFGYGNTFEWTCPSCGGETEIPFRITEEFFRPTINI